MTWILFLFFLSTLALAQTSMFGTNIGQTGLMSGDLMHNTINELHKKECKWECERKIIKVCANAESTVKNTLTQVYLTIHSEVKLKKKEEKKDDGEMHIMPVDRTMLQGVTAPIAAALAPAPAAMPAQAPDSDSNFTTSAAGIRDNGLAWAAKKAQEDANRRMDLLLQCLKQDATPATTVETESVNSQPWYVWVKERELVGWTVDISIRFRTETKRIGDLLASCAAQTGAQINSFSNLPTDTDTESGIQMALQIAAARALARAKAVSLGIFMTPKWEVINTDVTSSYNSGATSPHAPTMMASVSGDARAFAAPAPIPIAAGGSQTSASVCLIVVVSEDKK